MSQTRSPRPGIAALLVAAIAILALVTVGRIPGHGLWVTEVLNAAHAPAFAMITLLMVKMQRRIANPSTGVLRDYSVALVAAIVLGAVVELIQLATGRDASIGDLARDALGAVAALGVFSLFDPHLDARPRRRPIRIAGALLALAATTAIIVPVAWTGFAYLQRQRAFPTLVDFDSPVSEYFVRAYSAVTVERNPLPGSLASEAADVIGLHAVMTGNHGWGIALWEPYPDWRGYEHIALDLANPTDTPLLLQVHIRDQGQSRDRQSGYVGRIEVRPRSRQAHRIALKDLTGADGRARVDISRVHSIVLRRDPGNRAPEFYLARIGLE